MKKDERLNDYDFKECFKYLEGYTLDDAKQILACVPGEADGPSWHYIVKLKDGNFAYVEGSCDYTGWGCQENGRGKVATTALKAAKLAPEKEKSLYKGSDLIRKQLIDQLKGKQPYGLRI